MAANGLIYIRDLTHANAISISGHMTEDILIKFQSQWSTIIVEFNIDQSIETRQLQREVHYSKSIYLYTTHQSKALGSPPISFVCLWFIS